jgi:hypothetical protein
VVAQWLGWELVSGKSSSQSARGKVFIRELTKWADGIMLLAEVRVPGLSHKAGKLADALILLALAWVLFIGCVHKFPVRLSSESVQGYGIKGIFRDDFPFSISSKTPDLGTAIPPAREGCSVKILPYGPENFALRAELMKSARSYIYLQNYIFANDSTGQATAGIFKEKIGQGVAVYLIVDGYNLYQFFRLQLIGLRLK